MGSLLGFVNGYCLYSGFRNDINILFRTFIKSMPFYVRNNMFMVHASVGLLDQIKQIHKKLSENVIKMIYRSDSVGYDSDIIEYCSNNNNNILLPLVKTIFLSIYFLFLFPFLLFYNLLYLFMDHQEGYPS